MLTFQASPSAPEWHLHLPLFNLKTGSLILLRQAYAHHPPVSSSRSTWILSLHYQARLRFPYDPLRYRSWAVALRKTLYRLPVAAQTLISLLGPNSHCGAGISPHRQPPSFPIHTVPLPGKGVHSDCACSHGPKAIHTGLS